MPIYEDYYSDASFSSETESDEEEEDVQLYDDRDEDYWAIEALLDTRKPPPAIEYLCSYNAFVLRECVVDTRRDTIESVVDSKSVRSWHEFWRKEPQSYPARFSHDDWNAISEFAMQLCECCLEETNMQNIQSCIIRILSLGRFLPKPLVVALPVVRRR